MYWGKQNLKKYYETKNKLVLIKGLKHIFETGILLCDHIVGFECSIVPGSTITVTHSLSNNFVFNNAKHVHLTPGAILDIKFNQWCRHNFVLARFTPQVSH